MTRRLTIAILLSVWAMLIVSDLAGYLVTRSILLADLDATLLERASGLPELVHSPAFVHGASPEARDRYVIRGAAGQPVTRPAAGGAVEEHEAPVLVSASFARLADGRRVRTATVRAYARPTTPGQAALAVTVVYSAPADRFDGLLNRLIVWLLVGDVVLALIAAGIARWVSRAALRPLTAATEVVGSIDVEHLNRRVPAEALPAELQPMATRLNEMLARLEEAFAQRRQFLADASHELRVPVAALMTALEVALRRPRDLEEYRRILRDCLSDTQVLRSLVEALLEQVQGERFDGAANRALVDVSALVEQCATLVAALAGERGVTVVKEVAGGVQMVSEEQRWRSVLINVLSNAIEYNRTGGSVRVVLTATGEAITLIIADTGCGIAAEDLPHVFEPFFRADRARAASAQQHLGLGLFLVQMHVRALGGTCTVESTPGVGTTFRIQVPTGEAAGGETGRAGDTTLPGRARQGRGGGRSGRRAGPAGRQNLRGCASSTPQFCRGEAPPSRRGIGASALDSGALSPRTQSQPRAAVPHSAVLFLHDR